MKILFVIALSIEAKIIKNNLNFKIPGLKIDFLITKPGNFNVIYSVKNYIDTKEKPDFIVNIGVCGKKTNSDVLGFQVYKIKNQSNNKESICPIYIDFSNLKQILCSDFIVKEENILGEIEYVDMESFGVDYICNIEKIPYIILKKPFDTVGKSSNNLSMIDLENTLINAFDYQKLCEKIKYFLENDTNIEFNKLVLSLKQKHSLTFTQNEMLKKAINKKIAFTKDKNIIFKTFKKMSKDEILKELK